MSGPTLDDVPRVGFSKTARSRPGHREAGGDGLNGTALAVGRGRLTDDVAKTPAERAQAGKSHVEADIRNAAVGRAQQEHGAFDPPALQGPVGGLAEGRSERSDEGG